MLLPRLVDPAERVGAFLVGGEPHWQIGALNEFENHRHRWHDISKPLKHLFSP